MSQQRVRLSGPLWLRTAGDKSSFFLGVPWCIGQCNFPFAAYLTILLCCKVHGKLLIMNDLTLVSFDGIACLNQIVAWESCLLHMRRLLEARFFLL